MIDPFETEEPYAREASKFLTNAQSLFLLREVKCSASGVRAAEAEGVQVTPVSSSGKLKG